MITYILLIIGFIILIKGADWLVDNASTLAKHIGVSDIVIGLTIVAFGTSAPELVVNIVASIGNNSDLTMGNIIGSNISNILLILGVSALLYPLIVKQNTVWREIPINLFATLILIWFVKDGINRFEGILLLIFFVLFIGYVYYLMKSELVSNIDDVKGFSLAKSILFIIIGITGLTLGGKLVVDNAIIIATNLGLSELFIGLTIIAIGTSLPELATSIVAALKNKPDIAVGNIVGSNIFNILWIIGLSALINPINASLYANIDLIILLGATCLLFAVMFIGKRHIVEKWQGLMMVLLYIAYLIYLIIRG